MRILHVFEQAGVSGLLAREQRKLGHVADVAMMDGYDGFKQSSFYGCRIIGIHQIPWRARVLWLKKIRFIGRFVRLVNNTVRKLVFCIYVAEIARFYDVIHIHSFYWTSFLMPRDKPKVFHFHGDDIRRKPSFRSKYTRWITSLWLWVNRHRTFYVSTPDMLEDLPRAVWIPNVADPELFKPFRHKENGKAVYFHNWHERSCSRAFRLAREHGWDLTVVDRMQKESMIMFEDMPGFLGQFSFLIDRANIKSLSKTALEALACGLVVVNHEDQLVVSLPKCYNQEKVVGQVMKIYDSALKNLNL